MKEYFAIIGQRLSNLAEYKMLGTGYFIDNNGTFLTAGHVFREHQNSIKQFYICFPDGDSNVELIPIKKYRIHSRKLYLDNERNFEYPRSRKEYQCGPEYKDVALGKIEIQNTPYFAYQKKRPYEWDKLNMPCHNRNKVICPKNVFKLSDNLLSSSLIEFNNWNCELRERLRRARIPFLYEGMKFDNIDTYNNCIEVYGKGSIGNSGAPVLNSNNKIVGIFIAGTVFNDLGAVHLARYIYKKARKLMKHW
jgi:V8-like Glu-specific endopeptidase